MLADGILGAGFWRVSTLGAGALILISTLGRAGSLAVCSTLAGVPGLFK